MRISTNMVYELGATKLSELQSELLKTQQQISANRRLLSPSDDPIAAARALEVTQSQSINTQYATNRLYASNSLSLEETALQSVTSLLQDAKTQVVEAGNVSYDDTQRKYIATALRGRLEDLIGLANTRDGEGNYLFSGFQTATKPFSSSASGVQYVGDQGQRSLQVGSVRQLAVSDSGDGVFERIPSAKTFVTAKASSFSRLAAVAGNTGTTAASALTAINPALLTGHNYDVSVTDDGAGNMTYSVYDTTLDPTKASPPLSTGAYTDPQSISFDGMQMTLTGAPVSAGTDNFTVRPSTATASQLSVANVSLLTGHNYDVVFTDDGLGNMTYSAYDITLDPTKANPPAATGAYTSPQKITFDGLQMTVTGSPTNTDTFSVRPKIGGTQSVFDTIKSLITLLETPATDSVGKQTLAYGLGIANQNIASALDNILTVRASVGSRLKEIEKLDSAGEDRGLQYSATLSQLQDLDYAKAISDLSMQKTTLDAAQQSYVKIINLSLFSYL